MELAPHPWKVWALALPLSLLTAGCASPDRIPYAPETRGWATMRGGGPDSLVQVDQAVQRLALGDDATWRELKKHAVAYWGEAGSSARDAGLGELFYRAPLLLLERHLAGDPEAKKIARVGYALPWSRYCAGHPGFDARRVQQEVLDLYRLRLKSPSERTQVAEFIAYITARD